MAVEIQDVTRVLRELNRLFQFVRVPKLMLDEYVQITFDGLAMMVETVHQEKTCDLTGAAGTVTEGNKFIVPKGERWYLIDMSVGSTTGTCGGLHIYVGGLRHGVNDGGTTARNVDISGEILKEGDMLS